MIKQLCLLFCAVIGCSFSYSVHAWPLGWVTSGFIQARQVISDSEDVLSTSAAEIASSRSCFAEPAGKLSLSDVFDRIACSDPSSKRASAEHQISLSSVIISKSGFFPSIQAGASVSKEKNVRSYDAPLEFLDSDNAPFVSSGFLGVTWVMLDFGKRRSILSKANALSFAARHSLAATLERALENGAKAYYEVH